MNIEINWNDITWPANQVGDAIKSLAQHSQLAIRSSVISQIPNQKQNGAATPEQWIEVIAEWLELEAEPVDASYAELERMLLGAAPALLRWPTGESACFLALLGHRRRKVAILAPDLRVHWLKGEEIAAELRREMEAPLATNADAMLIAAGVKESRRARARAAIVREQLDHQRFRGCWLLRNHPGVSFWRQMRQMKLPRHLWGLVTLQIGEYALFIGAWWVLGQEALNGRLDRGWLIAWALLLFTSIPLRLLALWLQGLFTVGVGGLLKQRLLYGALRLAPDEIRHQGAGQLLSRVIESNAVESLALTGGFLGLIACVELIAAVMIMSAGAANLLHPLLLAMWIVCVALIIRQYFRRRGIWTRSRLEMTHDLIERMVGHRTRLAQEPPEHWHEAEDQTVTNYLNHSQVMDRAAVLQAMTSRFWLALGLIGLSTAVVSGSTQPVSIAVSVGGILLAYRGLEKLVLSLIAILSAMISWREIAQLFNAASKPVQSGAALLTAHLDQVVDENHSAIIEASNLAFSYQKESEPVLQRCNLSIRRSERLLLEGASGSGKSTLCSLLTGLRVPNSGLLLVSGLDHRTLGISGLRRKIAAAPQFHENHVLTGPFAFNVLMGRRWPPEGKDLLEAEAICRDLGLGNLLDRMPAGMLQMVGGTGWQLSHGERSRLYIARALLQRSELVILDESLAALDPLTLRQCLDCVINSVPTLLVIAHP